MCNIWNFRSISIGCLVVLILILLAPYSYSQSKRPNKIVNPSEKDISLSQLAIEHLNFLVDDLKQIDDLTLGLPTVGALVKKLSPHRPVRCRELLEALFAKLEEHLEQKEKQKNYQNSKYWDEANFRTFISIAKGFDLELAQKFIERISDNKKYSQLMSKTDAAFLLAGEVTNDNPSLAVSLATQIALDQFTTRTLEFIGKLRNKDPKLAASYTHMLLSQLETRKYPSIRELLYLYSYIFLSKRVPYIYSGGLSFVVGVAYGEGVENQIVDPNLAKRYLAFSVRLMFEQERYTLSDNLADARSDIIFINLILPSVQQYLPSAVEPLIQRKSVLESLLDPAIREAADGAVNRYNSYKENNALNELSGENTAAQIEKENYSREKKDQLYYDAARKAVENKKYAFALNLTSKLSISEQRVIAKNFILFDIAQKELADGKIEDARRYINDNTDPLLKAYVLTLIASTMAEIGSKGADLQRASEILTEVAVIASDLPPGAEKISILSGIATAYSRYDVAMSFEYLRRCVQSTEKIDTFNGSFGINRVLQINQFYYVNKPYQDKLNLYEAIANLARKNFNTAIIEAKSFRNPIAKARAIVAVCEAVI